MAIYTHVSAFNAGELSPKLQGRIDISQYGKGCSVLRNFLVTPYGAVERRPGTKILGPARYGNTSVRLIRFVYSSDVSYICEFGPYYIRFYADGHIVTHEGSILEVRTPYTEGTLRDLRYIQSADVMTIVHPDYPVQELRRLESTYFTLTEKEYKYPPVLDPNLDDDHTLTASGLEGEISLTANKSTFTVGNVGGYYQLIHTREENELSHDFEEDGESATIEVYGYWSFTTHGTWSGNLTIERSFDDGVTWSDYRTYSSAKDSNVSTSGEEEETGVLYRLRMRDYEGSGTGTLKLCRCLLVNPDYVSTGVVRITEVEDDMHAKGTVIVKLGRTTPTNEWNEGAWSLRRGYPRTISFYEERMMFGGTRTKPQTIWGSKTGSWDNFLTDSKDDSGLDLTLASDTANTIVWMCQHTSLVIGTGDSEWTLSSSDSGSALTPSNFRLKRQSVYGSSGITALMVGEVILFVQRGERKVREFVYRFEKDGYSSPDMTILADHITESGIVETAYMQQPDSVLWCVLGNGTLAALTYEREQEVIGWHKHETTGKVLSICVVPHGCEDHVYLAVERNGCVLIERMWSRSSAQYVDSGIEVTGTNITKVTGLQHLEGCTVSVLADGAVQREKVVSGGMIELDSPASDVTVGLSFRSVLSPMPLEVELQDGQSVLRKKAIGELRLRVYGSVGGRARCGADAWQNIISRDVQTDRMDDAVSRKDEVVILNMLSGYAESATIEVEQSAPLPLNVMSIAAIYEVSED